MPDNSNYGAESIKNFWGVSPIQTLISMTKLVQEHHEYFARCQSMGELFSAIRKFVLNNKQFDMSQSKWTKVR